MQKSRALKSRSMKSSATKSSSAKSRAVKSRATKSRARKSSAIKSSATKSRATKSRATKSRATKSRATKSRAMKLTPIKLTPMKSTPIKLTPMKSTPEKKTPMKSTPEKKTFTPIDFIKLTPSTLIQAQIPKSLLKRKFIEGVDNYHSQNFKKFKRNMEYLIILNDSIYSAYAHYMLGIYFYNKYMENKKENFLKSSRRHFRKVLRFDTEYHNKSKKILEYLNKL